MGNITFKPGGPKKMPNHNINHAKKLEQHLAEIVRQTKRERWLAENKGALDDYCRRIESHGTFSDGLRRF
jgi:antitoxin CcdA